MAYTITNSRGNFVATVEDGSTNTTSTPLTLIGKNFVNYGTAFNQNLVRSLENFAHTIAPVSPVTGQLWYDLNTKILKFYDDNNLWRPIGVHTPNLGAGVTPNSGDTRWNNTDGLFQVWNGTAWVSIGPTQGSLNLSGNITAANTISTVSTISPTGYFGNLFLGRTGPGSLGGDGNIELYGNIIPSINSVYNLGNVAFQWGNIFVSNVTVSNITPHAGANVTCYTSFAPSQNNAFDLGNVNFQWKNVFTAGLRTTTVSTTNLQNASGNIIINTSLEPLTNNAYDLGNSSKQWKNIFGTAIQALYADLAENYETDKPYPAGTVVQIGGEKEITQVETVASDDVWGVVSTAPAYLMNSGASSETHLPIGLVGKVPVRVLGAINKGDAVISAGNGVARKAESKDEKQNSFGRSLETNNDPVEKLVMVSIK